MQSEKYNVQKSYKTENSFKAPKSVESSMIDYANKYTEGKRISVTNPRLNYPKTIAAGDQKVWFDLEVSSTSGKHEINNNFGMAMIEKLVAKFGTVEFQCINDFNVLALYKDLWLTKNERELLYDQGIDEDGKINKIRVKTTGAETGASDEEKAIARVYGNRFCLPLSQFFEGTHHLPFVQSDGKFPLNYEFTLAKNAKVLKDTPAAGKTADPKFTISNLDFEHSIIENAPMYDTVKNISSSRRYLFDQIVEEKSGTLDKDEVNWQLDLKVVANSLKAVVILFTDQQQDFQHDSEKFYNPLISEVQVTLGDNPRMLYLNGMQPAHMYKAAASIFKTSEDSMMTMKKFFTNGFSLVLDFKSYQDQHFHGTGLSIDGGTKLHLNMKRKKDGSGKCNFYIFSIKEASVTVTPAGVHVVS